MTSKDKGHSCKVTLTVWQLLALKWRTKSPRNTKRGTIKRTSFKVKRSKFKVNRLINVYTVNAQYLLKRKAYKLQTWYTDGAWKPVSPTSAMTSKVARSHGLSDSCWPVSREQKVPETPKIGRTVATTGNNVHQVRDQKVKVTRPINAENENVSPTNFKLGRWLEHVLSTAMTSYKDLRSWAIVHGRGYTMSATPRPLRPHNLYCSTLNYF